MRNLHAHVPRLAPPSETLLELNLLICKDKNVLLSLASEHKGIDNCIYSPHVKREGGGGEENAGTLVSGLPCSAHVIWD